MFILLAIFFLQFADKAGSERVCLSPTAIEMRAERGIEIDSLDYEVSPRYLDSIRALGGQILHTSRWMNGATVKAKKGDEACFEKCSFVNRVYVTRPGVMRPPLSNLTAPRRKTEVTLTDSVYYGQAQKQLEHYNLLPLHQDGYHGQGIRIGIADAGFANADKLEALMPVRSQWLGYTDFTDGTTDIFDPSETHGSLCLSSIMAVHENYLGAATQAEYYLFCTEETETESHKEIDNWVAAIEMADSLGLHIVTTSLGYRTFDDEEYDFSYQDMDGHTTRGAKAATIAARKGMLLVVAMGNDGDKDWHYLSTPADADSILSVGAVGLNDTVAQFSSYGPASDGRVKPEVCAVGVQTALINPNTNRVTYSNGTSFACPLIAGMAACLWSALPYASNMDIRERIIRSADRYNQPHEQYGYGIPDAWLAYQMELSTPTNNIGSNRETKSTKLILYRGELLILHNNTLYDILGNTIKQNTNILTKF